MPQLGTKNRARIDIARLADALDTVCRREGLSLRQAAHGLELSPSTLTRIRQGHRPDADALAVLLTWLDISASQMLAPNDPARTFASDSNVRAQRSRPPREPSERRAEPATES